MVRNHLGIPLFAKALQWIDIDSVEYGELLDIIKGYVIGSPLLAQLIIESDSFLAVSCLSLDRDDLLELGALASHFLTSIDYSDITFSHVYQTKNFPAHHLAKLVLQSPTP